MDRARRHLLTEPSTPPAHTGQHCHRENAAPVLLLSSMLLQIVHKAVHLRKVQSELGAPSKAILNHKGKVMAHNDFAMQCHRHQTVRHVASTDLLFWHIIERGACGC